MTVKKLKKVYRKDSFGSPNLLHEGFKRSVNKLLKPGDWINVEAEEYSGGDVFTFTKGLYPWGYGGISIKGQFVQFIEDCLPMKITDGGKKVLYCDNLGIDVQVYYFADERYLYSKVIKSVKIPLTFIRSIKNIHEEVGVVRSPDTNILTYEKLNIAREYGLNRIQNIIDHLEKQLETERNKLSDIKFVLQKQH